MKPIENTDLKDMLENAAQTLLAEKRNDAMSRIKQILIRMDAMGDAVRHKENELKKLREKIEKASVKLDRLRKGDWAVLTEIEREEKQGQDERE